MELFLIGSTRSNWIGKRSSSLRRVLRVFKVDEMLLLPRVSGVLRCSTHTVKSFGCRYREFKSTAAAATASDKQDKEAAAAGKSDGGVDPHNILLYEAGSKASFLVALLQYCLGRIPIAVVALLAGDVCSWRAVLLCIQWWRFHTRDMLLRR